MPKKTTVFLLLISTSFGCGTYRYVKKPWAETSIEQAEAMCHLETAKTSAKGLCDSICQSNLMKTCMKAKGWDWTFFPKEN